MFKQYEVVKTTKTFSPPGARALARGTEGTIIDIYGKGKHVGYHVEFTYKSGKTRALLMLTKEDIEPLTETIEHPKSKNEVVQIRSGSVTPFARRSVAASSGVSAARVGRRPDSGSYKMAKPAKAAAKANTKKPVSKSLKPSGRKVKPSK